MNNLLTPFFQTSGGVAILSIIIVISAIAILDLNYKLFAKNFLDVVFSIISFAVLSPVFVVTAIVVKVREGDVFLQRECVGKDGKIIYVKSFCGNYGWLNNIPKLIDGMCGKLSIVGPKLMDASDAPFISDEAMARFNAKPGIISPLALYADSELTYDEMFLLDAAYVKSREMFKDFWIILKTLLYKIRGESKSYLGKINDKSYAQTLLDEGKITKDDIATAKQYVAQTLKNLKF